MNKMFYNKIITSACLISLLFLLCACSSNEEEPAEQPIAVTYATVAGTWQLTQYYGKPLPNGTYLYMVLDRKEHIVQLYSNLNSAYTILREGTYTIDGDDYYGHTISGSYGVLAGDWQHIYNVALYQSGYMQWTAKDDATYQQVFTRIDAVPQSVLDEVAWREE